MVPVQQNDRVFVGKEYIVEANDSLQSIAHRFGTSEENLVSVLVVRDVRCVRALCYTFGAAVSL